MRDYSQSESFYVGQWLKAVTLEIGGVSKSMLKQSRLNFDKIEKCE